MKDSKLVKQLETWEVRDFMNIIDTLHELWIYDNYINLSWSKCRLFDDDELILNISTGGWSDHEFIIYALEKNTMFWMVFWFSSQKGGHFVFKFRPTTFGYLRVADYCKQNNITRQSVSQNKHLYDWITVSRNINLIRKKSK